MEENTIIITEESLILANEISKNGAITFHNHWHILYDICNSLPKNDVSYLEIGVFAGASSCLMSKNPKTKKIYGIDMGDSFVLKNHFNWKISEGVINNVNNFKNSDCQFNYYVGNSHDESIINKIKEDVESVDILFLDGGHKYDDVLQDFNNYENLVCSGGYIVFDDYNDLEYCPEVKVAVNDIVKKLDMEKYFIIGALKYDFMNIKNNSG